jgi:hypothetical protein
MRPFGLAFTLWGGSILLCCGMVAVFGIFTFNGQFFAAAIIGFFVALFISFPLLMPTTLLIRVACKIPYSNTVRLYWLGFTLLLQNYLYFKLLSLADVFDLAFIFDFFILMSTIAMVFMIFFRRTTIKDFFSQQTTNKTS